MIKHILKVLLTITLYEAVKCITEQITIQLTKDDEVEAPIDFSVYDHKHLNEVSGWKLL